MVEIVYVDEGKTPAVKLGVTDDGAVVVSRLPAPEFIQPDEKGSVDVATHPAEAAA